MPTKAEQTEKTRAALIAAGRRLFAGHGFAGTSTEELVRTAGVTRGALYHHFRDKRDLFEAVYEAVEQALVEKVAVAVLASGLSPLETLRQGSQAFLDACLDPAVQRIALLEGPTVLGWERWREIDQRYGLGLVTATLQAAIDAGEVAPAPVEPLAHVMFGGLVEAAMLLAASPDPGSARREVGQVIELLIDGVAASRPSGGRTSTSRPPASRSGQQARPSRD